MALREVRVAWLEEAAGNLDALSTRQCETRTERLSYYRGPQK